MLSPPDSSSLSLSRGCWLALAAAGAALILCAAHGIADLNTVWLQDYVEYWAAGRLNVHGGNPYDPAALYREELIVSPELNDAIMMWNPPWTLTLAMPLGLMPARLGFVLWLWLNLTTALVCVDWLWGYYGGPPRWRWLAWVVGLSFAPTYFVLHMGQISLLILLGVVGFLYFGKRERWALAGAALALAAVKPHLAYLVGLALLLWAVDRRRWSVLLGGGIALALLTVLPLACNPQVIQQYRYAMAHYPPRFLCPTLGSLLRVGFGLDKLWLQFVPMALGLGWFGVHWWRARRNWVWAEQVPVLLLASFLTASYGVWQFDLVVLLVPVIQTAVAVFRSRQARAVGFALTAFLGFDAMALLMMNVKYTDQYWHVWMTPMILYTSWTLRRQIAHEPAAGLGNASKAGAPAELAGSLGGS